MGLLPTSANSASSRSYSASAEEALCCVVGAAAGGSTATVSALCACGAASVGCAATGVVCTLGPAVATSSAGVVVAAVPATTPLTGFTGSTYCLLMYRYAPAGGAIL